MDIQAVTEAVLERIFVEMEASGRHVHLTQEQSSRLFGKRLTPERNLSQPGQFLAKERVRVIGPKGFFSEVAVLGPERDEAQVELSATDCRVLGLRQVPVRLSGEVENTPGIRLEGPCGTVNLEQGVIVAKRHVHLTPADAEKFHVRDRQLVNIQTYTDRPVLFQDVVVRVNAQFAPRVHLDYDEANACGFRPGDLGRIVP